MKFLLSSRARVLLAFLMWFGKYGYIFRLLTYTHRDHISFVDSLGADEFIDYRKVTYQRSGRKFDRIIDLKASGRALQFSRTLKDKGRFTLVGGQARSIISVLAFGPLISLTRSKKATIMTHRPNKADVDELLKLCEDGVIQPMIDRVFELEDWHEAFDYYTSFEMKGKVILDIGGC